MNLEHNVQRHDYVFHNEPKNRGVSVLLAGRQGSHERCSTSRRSDSPATESMGFIHVKLPHVREHASSWALRRGTGNRGDEIDMTYLRGSSYDTRGRMGSWNDCREQSFMSTGESCSADATSDGGTNSNPRLLPSSSFTTSRDRTRATEPRVAHPLRSSGVPSANNVTRRPNVSTPLRNWTCRLCLHRCTQWRPGGPTPTAPSTQPHQAGPALACRLTVIGTTRRGSNGVEGRDRRCASSSSNFDITV